MRQVRRSLHLALGALAAFGSTCAAVEVHKCTAPDGTSVYSESPCPESMPTQWTRDLAPERSGHGFAYTVRIVDAESLLASQERRGLEENALAAAEFWAGLIRGQGRLDISFDVKRSTGDDKFHGTCARMAPKSPEGYYECGSSFELRTGQDVNGAEPDVLVDVDLGRLRTLWIDPDPLRRDAAVPRDQGDLVSVLAHEIGHGLGFNGWARFSSGLSHGTLRSRFDAFIEVENGKLYFHGPHAMRANGNRPVELCSHRGCDRSSYVYHLQERPSVGADVAIGLMGGRFLAQGARYRLAPEEIGVFRDLGLVFSP